MPRGCFFSSSFPPRAVYLLYEAPGVPRSRERERERAGSRLLAINIINLGEGVSVVEGFWCVCVYWRFEGL